MKDPPWRRDAKRLRIEVDEELDFHLEARVRELERRGLSPADARDEAARRLGDRQAVVADCVASDVRREQRAQRRELVADLRQDARVGARQLRRRPALALVAVLTLGVAIGATTSIYAVADRVLLRPLPYADADRVVTVVEVDLTRGAATGMSPANFTDVRESARSFSGLALLTPFSVDLTRDGAPEALRTWLVSGDFFDALGVRPILGRAFAPPELEPNGPAVALMGYGFWQQRFGGAASVVGRTLVLDGVPTEIVGVLPPSLEYPEPRDLVQPRYPREFDLTDRTSAYMYAVGRLREGATPASAQAELNAIAARLSQEHQELRQRGLAVVPLRDAIYGEVRPAVVSLAAGVGLLLLIACANIANLFLGRGLERGTELSLRGALGAGRTRLARQLITESLVLAAAGGVAGVAVTAVGIRSLLAVAPADLVGVASVGLDGRVLTFALGVTLLTAVLVGLAPAVRLSRPDLMTALRSQRGSTRHDGRLRRVLVVFQVALCVVLLVGAGLLGRSMARLLDNDLGFGVENRAALQLFLWDNNPTAETRIARTRELLDALEAVPGVQRAAAISSLPFHPTGINARGALHVAGRPSAEGGEVPRPLVTIATPGYFDLMGIPLRRGRPLTETDDARAGNVALVNEQFAREHFPGEDPIGQRVTIGVMSAPAEREIIGVVGNVRPSAFDSEPQPELYIPHAQSGSGSMTFVVLASRSAGALLPELRQGVWSVDPNQSIYHAGTMDELVAVTLAQRRFQLLLSAVFGAVAVALVMLGLYGVIGMWARQRSAEFGVRMALGATPCGIVRMVLMEALRVAAPGTLVGVAGALLVSRRIEHLLYGVAPTDASTLLLVAAAVLVVTLLAAYLPARAAARLDPVRAIRSMC